MEKTVSTGSEGQYGPSFNDEVNSDAILADLSRSMRYMWTIIFTLRPLKPLWRYIKTSVHCVQSYRPWRYNYFLVKIPRK